MSLGTFSRICRDYIQSLCCLCVKINFSKYGENSTCALPSIFINFIKILDSLRILLFLTHVALSPKTFAHFSA